MLTKKPRVLVGLLLATLLVGFGTTSCFLKRSNKPKLTAEELAGKKILFHFRASAHKTLDPHKQFDSASADMIENVYDTLLQYHYLKRPYQMEPNLLEKMPEKQADGLTYIFTLKKGVHFIDDPVFPDGKGRELTIDDVIYSIKRFSDANVNSLSYILIQGFIVGLDDFREQTRKLGPGNYKYEDMPVEGLKKIDNYTMSIKLTQANPLALFPFASRTMSIVCKEAVEKLGDEFQNHPVGTGPFYIKQFSRRGEMILAKNPNYHQRFPTEGDPEDAAAGLLADAGKQMPLVDEVHLPLIEEAQPAMLKFKKGQLDMIGLSKDDFNKMAIKHPDGSFSLKENFAKKYKLTTELALDMSYMGFNLNDPIVGGEKGRALRQAIAYAMNCQQWIDLLVNGRGKPVKTIVPIPIAGSEKDLGDDLTYYAQNQEMARKKLVEAGFPEGKGLPEITITYRSADKDTRQRFEFIRNELDQVGIKAKAEFLTFSAYLKKVEAGNFQMTDSGWQADFPDAENFLQLLYGPNKTPGPNLSNFANAEYDKLYEQSRFMENGPERYKIFRRMAEIVRDEAPVILRYTRIGFGLYQPWVKNFKRNMMDDSPYMYYSVDPTKKQQEVAH